MISESLRRGIYAELLLGQKRHYMNKKENIDFWLASSEENFKSMNNMFKSKEYMWSLFIGHLVIEKLLKANYVKMVDSNVPRTHDLLKLAVSAGIEIEEKKKDDLQYITLFNIETRYDEYKRDFQKNAQKYLLKTISTKLRN